MRRSSRISFGPGAASLILIVVILSMSVLGILSLMNSRNDIRLADRSTQVIQAVYALNAQAEHSFADLDAMAASCAADAKDEDSFLAAMAEKLPSDMTLKDNIVRWTLSDGYRTLECAVKLLPPGEDKRIIWTDHRLSAITEDIWN